MTVTLEVLNSETNLRRVQITRSAIIGRGRKCGLRIASSKVSRQHCELILKDGAVEVRDLGSSNGTFVNNKPLVPRVAFELDPDDELRLGSVRLRICFVAELETAEPVVDEDESAAATESSDKPAAAAAVAAVAVGAVAGDNSEPDFSDEDETAPAGDAPIVDEVISEERDANAGLSEEDEPATENVLASEPVDTETAADDKPIGDDDSFTLFSEDFQPPESNADDDGNGEFDDSSILDFLGNLD